MAFRQYDPLNLAGRSTKMGYGKNSNKDIKCDIMLGCRVTASLIV